MGAHREEHHAAGGGADGLRQAQRLADHGLFVEVGVILVAALDLLIAEHQRQAYQKCTQVSRKKIYASKPVLDIELSGYKIMATLMEVFIDAAVNPSRFYSKQLLRRVSNQYDIENESLEERIMAVLDYISGMTDIYALDIYQKINGISLPIV